MTPADIAAKIEKAAAALLPSIGRDDCNRLLSQAEAVRAMNAPSSAAAFVILLRAELVRKAEAFERKAAELRAWAREIGEG